MGTFFSSLEVSWGALKNLLPKVFKSTQKVQNVRQGGSWKVAIRNKKCSKLRDVQQVVAACVIL